MSTKSVNICQDISQFFKVLVSQYFESTLISAPLDIKMKKHSAFQMIFFPLSNVLPVFFIIK